MFEITGDDVATLSGHDLRILVTLLREAERRRHGLPTASATRGGDQNAPDDGVN